MTNLAVTYATTGMTLGLQIVGLPPPAFGAKPPYNLFEREIDVPQRAVSDGDDLRKIDPNFRGERFRQYPTVIYALKVFAQNRLDRSGLALALRWILDQWPTKDMWGTRHPDQVHSIDEVEHGYIDEASQGTAGFWGASRS